ncbi:putative fucosyltransferase-like protein [Impatiens glandulifera]|nr:putative fucosyltransferase-like protein [Impatiens glandulifera]
MGLQPNQRTTRPSSNLEEGPDSTEYSSNKKKWVNLMPLAVALVVIAEIAFLGRLDMVENFTRFNSWADSYQFKSTAADDDVYDTRLGLLATGLDHRNPEPDSCEEWLEMEDSVPYSRDFQKEPIVVVGGNEDWDSCSVGCKFVASTNKKSDAAFGQTPGIISVHRSMESVQYYSENDVENARRRGYNIVMTTSLSSDVPVGYFSWAEYDIMAPVKQPKTEIALAAAFISNCAARNFRLQALEALEGTGMKIDSYGGCHRNRDGRVDKVETLKKYKFSLAFENSNEEDYVTEKFFQSLVAGSIPVVVGAPNIDEFSPCHGCILHIRQLSDVEPIAKTMNILANDPHAYNQSIRWKWEGPSDSFKALVDMAAVHSSCRLCIHLATMIREKEEKTSPKFSKRPCKCTKGIETMYHVYVRERGRFAMESVFLRESNLSVKGLESAILSKFKSIKHVPVWKEERPESIRGGNELKIYRIYPVGFTQRQALYTFRFKEEADFKSHILNNPCPKFEVIFV